MQYLETDVSHYLDRQCFSYCLCLGCSAIRLLVSNPDRYKVLLNSYKSEQTIT
ncbi:hypothetical protein BO71DRAFT_135378 [Aspergillus ellipticus CBS 707.79]|uniref:Uncharacterized protein n=1 Tax=Aspergillus ellipticus CBS 707.79 TaxID=1448320 RepID=A0A319DJ73_9EURO|nr:hypothetical protein BO71DRAFT_135378 [Aspergillus ellipticus CBS 707.79]